MIRISKERVKREVREWIEAIIIAFVLTLIIRAFVVQAFKIPSSSMYPTLQKGDKLFVNKFIYRFREPERWEIIVFKYPEDPRKDFIKRLIAFEGEEVEIRDGMIYINGERQDPPGEIYGNVYYNQDDFARMGEPVLVPEDSYFVLGDNSMSSRDSRYWGFVPKKNMVGKAFVRWWPLSRLGRLDRMITPKSESS